MLLLLLLLLSSRRDQSVAVRTRCSVTGNGAAERFLDRRHAKVTDSIKNQGGLVAGRAALQGFRYFLPDWQTVLDDKTNSTGEDT
jgi:hypothetical protein